MSLLSKPFKKRLVASESLTQKTRYSVRSRIDLFVMLLLNRAFIAILRVQHAVLNLYQTDVQDTHHRNMEFNKLVKKLAQ